MVAFALVMATIVKGLFDYLGTYLVNYAGFSMITDLRNELYAATLRRSVAFFQKYATGTFLSAIVNDIEKVQYALSTVLAEFLQQFFTFVFTACVVSCWVESWPGSWLIFVPFIVLSADELASGYAHHAPGPGQTGGDPEHSPGDDYRRSHRQSLQHGGVGDRALSRSRPAALRANLRSVTAAAVSSPMMDIFGAAAMALMILVGRDYIKRGSSGGHVCRLHRCGVQALRSGAEVRPIQ